MNKGSEDRKGDAMTRQILAELSGLPVDDTITHHAQKIIFGDTKAKMNEEVIAILSDIRSGYNCFDADEEPKYRALSIAIEALRGQKVGKWINHIEDGYLVCPFCETNVKAARGVDEDQAREGAMKMRYCFWCGAKMEGLEDETGD